MRATKRDLCDLLFSSVKEEEAVQEEEKKSGGKARVLQLCTRTCTHQAEAPEDHESVSALDWKQVSPLYIATIARHVPVTSEADALRKSCASQV